MLDSMILDTFLRGLAVGVLVVWALGSLRSTLSRDQRLATVLVSIGVASWLVVVSPALWPMLGRPYVLIVPASCVGGLFWLFVVTTFEERRVTPATLAPAAAQLVAQAVIAVTPASYRDLSWWGGNLLGGVLALHACVVVARGWGGDLVEGRRRLRGVLLGLGAVFAATNVVFALIARLDPAGPWLLFTAGGPYGGAFASLVILAYGAMVLQPRAAVFGAPRRSSGPDPRAEAEERLILDRLNEVMAAGAWREERLTIGDLGGRLGAPEHRLRRLINQRLGHRNFADFVNGYRIEAAKQRLADPIEARTTVAAIAFDLGYGSLGPFYRAFRAATGLSPTDWRRQALPAVPNLKETT